MFNIRQVFKQNPLIFAWSGVIIISFNTKVYPIRSCDFHTWFLSPLFTRYTSRKIILVFWDFAYERIIISICKFMLFIFWFIVFYFTRQNRISIFPTRPIFIFLSIIPNPSYCIPSFVGITTVWNFVYSIFKT